MFNVGGGELIVIFILALVVLGPDKLPSAARQAGRYLSEFRRMSQGFQQELKDAMDIPELDDLKDLKKSFTSTVTSFATTTPSAAPSGEAEVSGNGSGASDHAGDATAASAAAPSGNGSGSEPPSVILDPPPTRSAPAPADGPGRRAASPVVVEGPSGSFT